MTGFDDKSGDIPHYHDHRERLRERFHQIGGESFRDYELLELILFQAIPRVDTKPIAKALLQKFGSFGEVLETKLQRKVSMRTAANVIGIARVVEANKARGLYP